MKKFLFVVVFVILMCNFASGQSFSADLERAKQIKLLESNVQDVEKNLGENSFKHFNYNKSGYFYTNFSIIIVDYTTGDCSDENEDWTVEKGKVSKIIIQPKDYLELQDIGIDYSKFQRVKLSGKLPKNRFAHYDKNLGIGVEVRGNEVEGIYYIPQKEKYSQLCDKREVKKHYFGKKWERHPLYKKAILDYNFASKVTEIKLSQTEIIADCNSFDSAKNEECLDNKKVLVNVSATDPENDVLTYEYKVSGGKIIGKDAEVTWDLSEVEVGQYTITVVTDDGCGFCGKWMMKTVIVK